MRVRRRSVQDLDGAPRCHAHFDALPRCLALQQIQLVPHGPRPHRTWQIVRRHGQTPRLTVILRGELPRLVAPLLQPVTALINILFPDYRHTPHCATAGPQHGVMHGVMHGVWAVRMCCAAPRMFGHTSRYGWEASHTTREPPCRFVYVQTYVMRRMEGIPLYLGPQCRHYVCPNMRRPQNTVRHGRIPERSGRLRMPRHTGRRGNRNSNPDSPTPRHRTRMLTKTQEAEACTTHHTCSAKLPPLWSTGVDRR